MGFRFFRRIRILPGVRLNLNRSGVSTSVGGRGAWYTFDRRQRRTTVDLPGTGLSYTTTTRTQHGERPTEGEQTPRGNVPGWVVVAVIAVTLCIVGKLAG